MPPRVSQRGSTVARSAWPCSSPDKSASSYRFMTQPRIPSLQEFLQTDLDYICGNLQEEFGRMAGQSMLITGGAGFLGYYLVLSALQFNRTAGRSQPIRLTVWDNFIRGTPKW